MFDPADMSNMVARLKTSQPRQCFPEPAAFTWSLISEGRQGQSYRAGDDDRSTVDRDADGSVGLAVWAERTCRVAIRQFGRRCVH